MTNYCPFCFSETTLRRELKILRAKINSPEKCDFHPTRKAVPSESVVALFDRVIRGNFWLADDNPFVETGSSLADLINDLAEPEDDEIVVNLVRDLIDSDDYDPRDGGEPFYEEYRSYTPIVAQYNPHAETWSRFKEEVLHRRRFLSDLAKQYLTSIFEGLGWQRDQLGRSVIYQLLPDSNEHVIYRARQINSVDDRKKAIDDPSSNFGPPPKGLRRANRMNAAGIPAFYGAFDQETCIAENRPPVGCFIVGAAFRFKRPVTVLDLTSFKKPVQDRSLFSTVYRDRLDQWQFMQQFMQEISKPVLPNDEALDYVPTQIVSEFLNSELPVKIHGKECQIEGIIYSSAQNKEGRNIVLFGDAALVEQNKDHENERHPEEDHDDWIGGFSDVLKFEQPQPTLSVCEGTTFETEVHSVKYTSTPIVRDFGDIDVDFDGVWV